MDTKVIVRDCEGVALIRYLIGNNERVGYLTDNQGLKEFHTIGFTERSIGFPLSDIFVLGSDCGIAEGDSPDWSRLKHWSAE